uniref:Nucleolar protein 16 n=1 Tax=Parastrongyloides trichosuri TaxID=131310 RepID=A0A0N5A3X1_PARTI
MSYLAISKQMSRNNQYDNKENGFKDKDTSTSLSRDHTTNDNDYKVNAKKQNCLAIPQIKKDNENEANINDFCPVKHHSASCNMLKHKALKSTEIVTESSKQIETNDDVTPYILKSFINDLGDTNVNDTITSSIDALCFDDDFQFCKCGRLKNQSQYAIQRSIKVAKTKKKIEKTPDGFVTFKEPTQFFQQYNIVNLNENRGNNWFYDERIGPPTKEVVAEINKLSPAQKELLAKQRAEYDRVMKTLISPAHDIEDPILKYLKHSKLNINIKNEGESNVSANECDKKGKNLKMKIKHISKKQRDAPYNLRKISRKD